MGAETLALTAFAFVLTYAIHSTLLLGLACVAAPRVAALRVRERLWKLALFGGLVTAGVQVGSGLHTPLAHWSLRTQPATASVEPAPNSELAEREIAEQATVALERALLRLARAEQPAQVQAPRIAPFAPISSDPPRVAAAPESVSSVAPVQPSEPRAEPAPAAATVESGPGWTRVAAGWLRALDTNWRAWLARGLVAWAAFSALMCALFAWMWLRLARRLRGRFELTGGALRAALDRLVPSAFPRGRRIRLFVAPDLGAPLSFGWLRPAICVPPRALAELSHDEQETMLAHELAHLKRRDPVWLSLAWFVERVFFFQPLNRVARAQLHDAAELLCDEWAVRRTGNRVALASCLARIAGWIVGPTRALPATSMAEGHGRSRLGQRIERLLDEHALRREEASRGWIAPVAAGMLTVAVLVVPGVSAENRELASRDVVEDPASLGGGAALDAHDDDACELDPGALDAEAADALDAAGSDAQAATPQAEPPQAELPSAPPQATEPPTEVAQPAAPPSVLDVSDSYHAFAALDEAVVGLERELASLRAELADLDQDDQLAPMLDRLEERAAHLAARRTQLRRLLTQIVSQAEQADSGAAIDEFETKAR
jgi:beta-lactamase regulating signal transducer with metallopeptidase domain